MKRPESVFGSAFVGSEAELDIDSGPGLPAQRYVVQSELGRGGMGVVYLASDRLLGRDVALKRPRADLPPAVRQQVVREAAVTARLPHPGIVPVLDAGEDEQGFYYTMPVLDGWSFREWSTDRPMVAVVRALARACEALGYAHARGIVHRDVKPDNLHVGRHGEVRILDWGLAQDPAHPLPGRVGTPGYSAPEQSTGDPVGPEADVFALGRVLVEATAQASAEAPELQSIATRALHPDPVARFVDANALEQELQAWLDGERVRSHDYTAAALVRRWAKRYRVPVAIGGLGLSGVLVALAIGGAARWSEHRRAEAALAGSLGAGAATAHAAGERGTAERLASEALAHAEDPVARGVASQWWGIPRMRVGRIETPPCSGTLQSNGVWICQDASGLEAWRDGERLARWTPPSVVEGSAAAFDLGPEDWELQEARWDDELGLIARMGWVAIAYSGTDEHAGDIVYTQQSDNARLFDGPATIGDDARVLRRLTDEGLGPELGHCERSVFDAAVRDDGAFLLACREGTVHIRSDADAPVRRFTVSENVYAVGWLGGVGVLGSVDGRVARVDSGFDSAFDWRSTGAGAIEQFVRFGPRGWLAARDERGRVVVMDGDTLAVLDTLPGHHDAIAGGDTLRTVQRGDLRHWTADPGLVPIVVDRRELGGISALDLDPTGTRLIVGHASGAVEIVRLEDGAVLPLATGASDVAKTAVWLDDETVRYHDGTRMVHHRLGDDERVHASGAWWNRDASSWEGDPWFASTGRVFRGDYERQLDAIVLDLHRGTHELTGLGESGTIWRLAPDGPVVLANAEDWARLHVVADDGTIRVGGPIDSGTGGRLTSLGPDGVTRWSVDLARPVTALTETSRGTVVGTLDGGVTVVDPDGDVRATVPRAHDRRVSFLAANGPHVVSASWDGTIRRWNLDAVFAPRAEVRAVLRRDRTP